VSQAGYGPDAFTKTFATGTSNKQSADSYINQLHVTLKCTKDQSCTSVTVSYFSKWAFQHHDPIWPNFTQDPSNPWCVSS